MSSTSGIDFDPYNISLNPKQKLLFTKILQLDGPNDYDEFVFFGGFGCGKSFGVMLPTVYLCSQFPGMDWLYLRFTYKELTDSVIPQFQMFFPPSIWKYNYYSTHREFRFSNGSIIRLRAFDTDSKVLSNQYHGASVCQAEEIPKSTIDHIWGRIRFVHPGYPKKIMILEGNPAPGWAKQRYKDNPIPPNVFFIEATTFENDKLADKDGYINSLLSRFSSDDVRRFLYSEWETHADKVFCDFNEKINVIAPISVKKHWFTICGLDYGWRHPTVILWGSVDEFGNIIIWDEFYDTQVHFEEIYKKATYYGIFPTVADYAIKRADRDGKSLWTELVDMGLPLIESTKDELRDLSKINQLFSKMKLYITANCVNTIKEVRELKWKLRRKDDGIKIREEPVDKNNDAVDALRYLISYIEDVKVNDPAKIDYTQTLEYQTFRNESSNYEILI